MSFDLNQLLQGKVPDYVLIPVTKKFGLSNEDGEYLLTKGMSMVVGGIAKKATVMDEVRNLFNLIKSMHFKNDPADIIISDNSLSLHHSDELIGLGESLLPGFLGRHVHPVVSYLANSAKISQDSARNMLGMLLPLVISSFKKQISSGISLSGFIDLVGKQLKLVSSNLDREALNCMGFSDITLDEVSYNINKVGMALGQPDGTMKENITFLDAERSISKSNFWTKIYKFFTCAAS